jgi:hypothetical protein
MTEPTLPIQKKPNAFPFDSLYEKYVPQLAPIYERNYAARSATPNNMLAAEASSTKQVKASITPPPTSNAYPPTTVTQRFFHVNTRTPLLIEVVLALFTGIFGVGWLLIGKKRIGTILLLGSMIFYLPLLIISYGVAYFSYGLSILCTGPLAIGAVLLNAFMLHKTMQSMRKYSRV